ncbi:TPA: phage tail protein [Streptococcus agalactiae]|nr:phage tail protein [Streptococcus agalactiae]
MQITFYDKNMFETAVADNALLNAIKIKKASLTSLFEEATHQVEFEFSKEFGEWWGIRENGYLAFKFRGRFFRFSIVKFKENAKNKTIEIVGDYFNLEMLNENCSTYEKQPARTIVQHFTAMEILPYANFEIGVNELASSTRTLTYTGDEVKYKRLISIINNFGGECEFEIRQKANGQFDKLVLNIYRANDGINYQGVGRNRRDFEITIDNSNDVSRTVDSTAIKTSIEPIGRDGLRIGNRGTIWKNSEGQVEFYQKNNRIYAPLAAEEMPRVLESDKFLLWKLQVDTDTIPKLEAEGLKWLRNVCYAKEIIEVSGSFDVEVGDTVILNHKGIGRYGILGSLRVMKVTWDLLTETSEVTFANFKRLASKISAQGLALQNSIESPASYDITFNTTAGTVFKNNTGSSNVSFNFSKNGAQTAVLGQRWYKGTQLLSNGLEVMIKPNMLTEGKLNLRLEVDVTSAITFSKELTFINVNDGVNGSDGRGITSTEDYYMVSANKMDITSATSGWIKDIPQIATPANKYHWHYHVDVYTDGTRKETVPAIIGIYGSKGSDGATSWTAWANSKDGKVDFSITEAKNRRFIGTYTGLTQSTNYLDYKWIDMSANVVIGTQNLLDGTKSFSGSWFTEGTIFETTKISEYPFEFKKWKSGNKVSHTIEFDVKAGVTYTFTAAIARENAGRLYFYLYDLFANHITSNTPRETIIENVTTDIQMFKVTFVPLRDGKIKPRFAMLTSDAGWFMTGGYMLVKGNKSGDWQESEVDRINNLDTKADQELTQAQILALEERTAIARENAIAEAMQNTLSEVETKWKLWYDLNTIDEKQKVANDIAQLFDRTTEFKQLLGEASARFSFINNETLIGEEGVAIGDKGGKAKLFLSNDSISFVTNGVAQMTLTGDTLTIKNGLFTERIQIGNFVEEVYDRNPLFNVIRAIRNS